jgi:hypothetical protein
MRQPPLKTDPYSVFQGIYTYTSVLLTWSGIIVIQRVRNPGQSYMFVTLGRKLGYMFLMEWEP